MPAVLAASLAPVLMLVLATSAAAMPSEAPDETWGTNGRVNAIVQVGDIVYIGGNFSEVREDGGAGPGVLPRSHLAAFDATTGQPTSWAPSADGEVFAVAASPDGGRIYAGGAFTRINGFPRGRLAAVEAGGTGLLDTTWSPPSPHGWVMALALGTDKLYVGGRFTSVGGQPRARLAAFSTSSGALDPAWVPAADGAVRALAISAAGTVYAGGVFSVVSGQSRKNAVALGAVAGEVISGWRPDPPGQKVFSLAIQDDTVYAGIGGTVEAAAAWDAVTARERWRRRTDGDVQAVAVSGNILYVGGHFNYVEGELRRKLVALDTATGALRRDWLPKLPATSTTWYGVASLSTHGQSRLVAGGDFDTVSGVRHERYAQWTGSIGGADDAASPTDVQATADPPQATADPPIAVPPDRTPPTLRMSRRATRVRARRIVIVRVRCPRSERVCTGTLTLRRAQVPGRRNHRSRVLARAPFRASGGRSRDVRVGLSARGRRLLRRVRRLRVTATAVVRDDAGNIATVAQSFTVKWRQSCAMRGLATGGARLPTTASGAPAKRRFRSTSFSSAPGLSAAGTPPRRRRACARPRR